MEKYIGYIKKYGLFKCIYAFCGNCIFIVLRKLYLLYLCKFCEIEENKIIFSSTPSFSDNSKALYEYLGNNANSLKFVWIIDEVDTIPICDNNTIFVKRRVNWHGGFPFATLRQVFTSKYLFFTHESPFSGLKKREDQIVINLWHGCGYKAQTSNKPWILQNPCDYSLVPGSAYISSKSIFWGVPENRIITIGYPRYDLFRIDQSNSENFTNSLKKNSKKLIIWMPTYRKSIRAVYPEGKIQGHFELPVVGSVEQLTELNEFCRNNHIALCIKRHPSQIKYVCEDSQFSNIVFISNNDLVNAGVDLYSFLRYTDALISDYSSVAIDYLLLDKPIAFALDDFEQYKEARGFVFEDPLKYMPGHHLYTYEDMLAFIDDVAKGNDPYKADRAAIMPEVHNPCDNYCERVWETVKNLSLKERM